MHDNLHKVLINFCADTVVSHIYAGPRFATLALESVGGAYMQDLTFYLANTPPLPGPRLDVDIGTLQCSKQREYILLFGTNLCITSKLHHLSLKKS